MLPPVELMLTRSVEYSEFNHNPSSGSANSFPFPPPSPCQFLSRLRLSRQLKIHRDAVLYRDRWLNPLQAEFDR